MVEAVKEILYLRHMPSVSLSSDTSTVITMLEDLPAPERKVIVEKLRDMIEEWEDEHEWDEILARNQETTKKLAREARQQIAEGKVSPMEF